MKNFFFQIFKQQAGNACLLLIFLIINSYNSAGQSPNNLVPNYSFEDYIICPSNLSKGSPPLGIHLPLIMIKYI